MTISNRKASSTRVKPQGLGTFKSRKRARLVVGWEPARPGLGDAQPRAQSTNRMARMRYKKTLTRATATQPGDDPMRYIRWLGRRSQSWGHAHWFSGFCLEDVPIPCGRNGPRLPNGANRAGHFTKQSYVKWSPRFLCASIAEVRRQPHWAPSPNRRASRSQTDT